MITLSDGSSISKLGQGTWKMGENPRKREEEIAAVRKGIELGITMIDTAEMYGDGKTETLIGEAIVNIPREKLYLVSKVYPFHAGKDRIFKSCEDSLKRLGVDYLDLYLLHWRGRIPLSETAACMEELVERGRIKRWGVSNFDLSDMKELLAVKKGENCRVNQVLYHLGSRGIEYDLMPWQKKLGIPVMAYCPVAQGGSLRNELLNNGAVQKLAQKHNVTVVQLLLSFVLLQENVAAIPKASEEKHVLDNYQALDLRLAKEDMDILNREFPSPARKMPLDIV